MKEEILKPSKEVTVVLPVASKDFCGSMLRVEHLLYVCIQAEKDKYEWVLQDEGIREIFFH